LAGKIERRNRALGKQQLLRIEFRRSLAGRFGKASALSIAGRFQNFSKNPPDVLVVLLRGDAEGVDDVEQQIGILASEVVVNRLLGSGAASFAGLGDDFFRGSLPRPT
jgi:hypothetical protein